MSKSPDEILKLKKELELFYTPARTAMKQAKDYYDLKLKNVPTPSTKYSAYIPSTARSIIDKAVDHIIVGNPVVTVPPQKTSAEAQKQADKLEQFYTAWLKRIDTFQKEPLFRTAAKFGLLCGMFVIKGPLWDVWSDKKAPQQRETEKSADFEKRQTEYNTYERYRLPIIARAIDPESILISPGSFPPEYVIEVVKKSDSAFKERWEIKEEGEIEWVEYWDKENKVFFCNNRPVQEEKDRKNILGFLPYLIGYSGLGYASEKPEDEIVGLLNPVFSALEAEARIMTALDFIIQRHAYPIYYSREDPSKVLLDLEPGQIAHIPEGYDLGMVPIPQSLPDLYRMAQIITSHIERATYSDVIHGIRPEGVASGYMEAILVGQARLKFGPVLQALEIQGAQLLSNIARLIEVTGKKVTVWATTPQGNIDEKIGPEDISGHYTVNMQLSAVTPEEAERKAIFGLKLYTAGVISLVRFLENYALIPNASEEIKRIRAEQIFEIPEVKRIIGLIAAKDLGLEELRKELDPTVFIALLQSLGLGHLALPSPTGAPGEGIPSGGSPQPTPTGTPTPPATPGSREDQELIIRQVLARLQRLGGPAQGGELGTEAEQPFPGGAR